MRRVAVAAFVTVIALALIVPAATAKDGRPFWGRSSGVTTFYDNSKGCAAEVTTKVNLPAMASHLGRSRLITSHCPTETGMDNGDLTLIAANGDRLIGTYVGDVTPSEDFSVFYATLTITFDGGTGRFDDAHGTAVMKAIASVPAGGFEAPEWPWSATWSGWLTY